MQQKSTNERDPKGYLESDDVLHTTKQHSLLLGKAKSQADASPFGLEASPFGLEAVLLSGGNQWLMFK